MKHYIALLSALLMLAVLITGCTPGADVPTNAKITAEVFTTAAKDSTIVITEKIFASTATLTQVVSAANAPVADTDVDGLIPPGTENWSDSKDALTIVVDNEVSHTWDHYGLYFTHPSSLKYTMLTDEDRETIDKLIFDDLNVGMVGVNFPLTDYHTTEEFGYYVQNFGETLGIGDGSLLDGAIERDLLLDICASAHIPAYMLEEGKLKDEYLEKYAQMLARAVYDLKEYYDLDVKLMGTGDEPDLSNAIRDDQMPVIVKTMRQYLDKYGLVNTVIASNETANLALNNGLHELRQDQDAWDALGAISGHDFNTGVVTKLLSQAQSAWNKPMYSTSSGYDGYDEKIGDWLKRDADGIMSVEDYMKAIQNSSAILTDMNLGASGYLTFNAVSPADTSATAATTDFSLVYFDIVGGMGLGDTYAISANYKYTKQINNTIGQNATIYKSYMVTEDGIDWMTERDNWSRDQFNEKVAFSTGHNSDGTWGINILNKTDDDIYASMTSQSMKPMAGETLTINLDVRSLYGTGVQEFEMWSITPQSTISEMVGTFTLVDGRGTIEVFPFELMSLRSVNSIDDNFVADEYEDLFANAGVFYMGYDFAYIRGEKVDLKVAPSRENTSANGWCTKIALEDFATMIGGTYSRKGDTITVACEWDTFTFEVGDTFMKHGGGTAIIPSVKEESGVPMLTLTDLLLTTISKQTGYEFEDIGTAIGLIMIQYDEYDMDTPITNLSRLTSRFENEI